MAGHPPGARPAARRPRVKTPTERGIGGTETSIYSVRSRAPLAARPDSAAPLRPAAAEPILLRAGDHVRFRPIEPAEFEAIAEAVASGAYRPRIEVDP